jgi:hypothetical protein
VLVNPCRTATVKVAVTLRTIPFLWRRLRCKLRPSTCECPRCTEGCSVFAVRRPLSHTLSLFRPKGSEPWCDLCSNGGYPGKPNTVTAIIYMPGNPSCHQLYHMGRTGNIPDKLCNPLVDFFHQPCGCAAQGTSGSSNGGGASAVSVSNNSTPRRKNPPNDDKKKLYKKDRKRGSGGNRKYARRLSNRSIQVSA